MGSKVTIGGQLMFPNEFLAAVELKGRDVAMTIATVSLESLKMRGGKSERKPVITFRETPKKLVVNKTNADSISVLYGTEASAWVDKRVTLYPTKTTFGRETVDCIRVRERVPNGATSAPAPEPEAARDGWAGPDAPLSDTRAQLAAEIAEWSGVGPDDRAGACTTTLAAYGYKLRGGDRLTDVQCEDALRLVRSDRAAGRAWPPEPPKPK